MFRPSFLAEKAASSPRIPPPITTTSFLPSTYSLKLLRSSTVLIANTPLESIFVIGGTKALAPVAIRALPNSISSPSSRYAILFSGSIFSTFVESLSSICLSLYHGSFLTKISSSSKSLQISSDSLVLQ